MISGASRWQGVSGGGYGGSGVFWGRLGGKKGAKMRFVGA